MTRRSRAAIAVALLPPRVPPRVLVAGLVAVLLLVLSVSIAQPALASGLEDDPENGWLLLSEAFAVKVRSAGIGAYKLLATTAWWCEKLVAIVTGFLMEENLWTFLWNQLIVALGSVTTGPLRDLILGGGGATGLLYVAIALAGVLMTVPMMGSSSMVKADRAIIWAGVAITLFISNTFGLDMIAGIENMRMATCRMVLDAGGTDGLNELVARPMRASASEVANLAFELPSTFQSDFFRDPNFDDRVGEFNLGFLSFTVDFRIETGINSRANDAIDGTLIALLTLVPAWVVGMFGASFAMIGAAALVLIVFFVASIPLGFFEFGVNVINGIVKQYVYLFAITILASVLAGVLVATTVAAFPAGSIDLLGMVGYLPTLLVVGVGMKYVSSMALKAMTGTFDISGKMVADVGSMAYVGAAAPSKATGGAMGGFGGLGAAALTMGLAAATGGTSALLAAGVGALGSSSGAGRAAARVAITAAPNSRAAQTFAAATYGQRSRFAGGSFAGAAGVVSTNIRFNRLDKREAERRQSTYETTASRTAATVDPRWAGIFSHAGRFLTTNLGEMGLAERAFFKKRGKRPDQKTTRRRLERAFGSADVADDVLSIYQKHGKAGARQVHAVTEACQAGAFNLVQRGQRVFDDKGQATLGYRNVVKEALRRSGVKFEDQDDAQRWGRIAGSVVRRPTGIWANPAGVHKLVRDTRNPGATEVAAGDTSAQYKLSQLTAKWEDGQLTALFETMRRAMTTAAQSDQPVHQETLQALLRDDTFKNIPMSDLEEASRLGTLVADGAEIQEPVRVQVDARAQGGAAGEPRAIEFDRSAYLQGFDALMDGNEDQARMLFTQSFAGAGGGSGAETEIAERLVQGLGELGPRAYQPAMDLSRMMQRVNHAPPEPEFDGQGLPTPEYRDQVLQTMQTGGYDPAALEIFERMADDVLRRVSGGESGVIGVGQASIGDLQLGGMWGEPTAAPATMAVPRPTAAPIPPPPAPGGEDAARATMTEPRPAAVPTPPTPAPGGEDEDAARTTMTEPAPAPAATPSTPTPDGEDEDAARTTMAEPAPAPTPPTSAPGGEDEDAARTTMTEPQPAPAPTPPTPAQTPPPPVSEAAAAIAMGKGADAD